MPLVSAVLVAFLSLWTTLLLLVPTITTSVSAATLPLTYVLRVGEKECAYDVLDEDEHLTVSLALLEGDYLQAYLEVEGPVSPKNAGSGSDVAEHAQGFDRGRRNEAVEARLARGPLSSEDHPDVYTDGVLRLREVVDYEREDIRGGTMGLPYGRGGDDDDDYEFHGSFDDDEAAQLQAEVEQRRTSLERKKRREQRANQQSMANGEPYQRTVKVFAAGWYRACFSPVRSKVKGEFEIRKSSENGQPIETGYGVSHVPSRVYDVPPYFAEMDEVEEDVDAADAEDLRDAKKHLEQLQRAIDDMRRKREGADTQARVRETVGDHSASRLVQGSMVETMLFFAVSALQVYVVRKWFVCDGPLLGR